MKTDLPSPKPNRRRRLAQRFAVLVVAVSALGAGYWFTRPPELVWWRSPPLSINGLRAYAFAPYGWELETPAELMPEVNGETWEYFHFHPVDRRPSIVRRLFQRKLETGTITIAVVRSRSMLSGWQNSSTIRQESYELNPAARSKSAMRYVINDNLTIGAVISYETLNGSAFENTFRQVCNSLRIE